MRATPSADLFNRVARATLAAAVLAVPGVVGAVDFPVAGTMTVNGNAGALPAGGTFSNSAYDGATGAIATGKFTFPQATITSPPAVVTYQLSQLDNSSGQVAADGVAALSVATMSLKVVSATYSGIPVPVGTCVLQPISVTLTGTGSADGLDMSDSGFAIPPVGPTDCGGFASQINAAIAGSNNGMQLHLEGDFTPPAPADADLIFENGFDPVAGIE